jgi:hypothetical protein
MLEDIRSMGGKMGDEIVEKLIKAVVEVRPEPSEKIIHRE